MLWLMGRNVIISEETVRDLLEAHASLSAWYYELWSALRAANGGAHPPDDAARAAFVERLVTEFPEVAAIARSIKVPRMYVPAPPRAPASVAPPPPPAEPEGEERLTLIEPASVRRREALEAAAAKANADYPPLVDPKIVKYDP
jgi:hypothetical protein